MAGRALEMIPLQQAARVAHEKIFAQTVRLSDEAIDVIATTLARYLVVYGRRGEQGQAGPITESQLACGTFRDAASRFEFRDEQASITQLMVRQPDLERTLQILSS